MAHAPDEGDRQRHENVFIKGTIMKRRNKKNLRNTFLIYFIVGRACGRGRSEELKEEINLYYECFASQIFLPVFFNQHKHVEFIPQHKNFTETHEIDFKF